MKKVLVTDPIHEDAVRFMKESGLEVDQKTKMNEEELIRCIGEYDALICRTSTKVPKSVIDAADKLACIGVHATGWDHIDIEAATKKNITLLGYPSDKPVQEDRLNGSFIPVSEYVIMAMLVITKRFMEATTSMKSEKWEKYKLCGGELYGKTLGIIGLGRIGSLVAEKAKAFGMRVIAYHPRISATECSKRGAEQVPLDQLYTQSDFITIHVPKTAENIGLINKAAFSKMKKKPVIINTSRAPIIDEKALEEALQTDSIRTAVLDVFNNAPSGVNWDLVKNPKVLATPHIAGVSDEGLKRVSGYISKIVTAYLTEGKKEGLINSV